MARAVLAAIVLMIVTVSVASAQTGSCTSLSVGQTQDITAFSVCKRVTLNSVPSPATGVAGICVPTAISAAVWQSFYDNPPPGVTIAACASSCTQPGEYLYNGYCYRWAGDSVSASCDTVCAATGGCNLAGVQFIGSDDSSSSRCSAVASVFSGTATTASGVSTGRTGCILNSLKGGWMANNFYQATTTCSDTTSTGRICACNGDGGAEFTWGNASGNCYASVPSTPAAACPGDIGQMGTGTYPCSTPGAQCKVGAGACAPTGTVWVIFTCGVW